MGLAIVKQIVEQHGGHQRRANRARIARSIYLQSLGQGQYRKFRVGKSSRSGKSTRRYGVTVLLLRRRNGLSMISSVCARLTNAASNCEGAR